MKKIQSILIVLALSASLFLMVITIILITQYKFIMTIVTFSIGYILKIIGIEELEI